MNNTYYLTSNGSFVSSNELYHHGIKGMKWGVRKRSDAVGLARSARRTSQASANMNNSRNAYKQAKAQYRAAKKAERNSPEAKAHRIAKAKRAAKVGAAVVATALAAYGAYKLNSYVKTKNAQIAAAKGYKQAQKVFKRLSESAYDDVRNGRAARAEVSVNAGAAAISRARAASKENFRTAARNVVNYKRSGGKLKTLLSVDDYKMFAPERLGLGKRN